MSECETTTFKDLIALAHDLKQILQSALLENDYSKADHVSLEYGEVVEKIISQPIKCIDDYAIKVQFFFETLLDGEGDKVILSKCQKSLITDLSKFNVDN